MRMFERLTKAFSHFCVKINERFVSKSFSSYIVNLNNVMRSRSSDHLNATVSISLLCFLLTLPFEIQKPTDPPPPL